MTMKKENYIPQPIDTTDVKLPKELIELGEVIARNVHEVWAAGRVKDGWTYGTVRDDVKKTHPCLIPYEELTETEKDYDRRTALQSLRLMVKLGFRISI
jgi:hypothetical protein